MFCWEPGCIRHPLTCGQRAASLLVHIACCESVIAFILDMAYILFFVLCEQILSLHFTLRYC